MKTRQILTLAFCLSVLTAGSVWGGPRAIKPKPAEEETAGENQKDEEQGLLSKPSDYEEKTFDPSSLPNSYGGGDSGIINGNNVMHYLYNSLRDAFGFNHAAACAILANASHESGFNYSVLGDGGTSFGIMQWHEECWIDLQNWCNANGYDWQTLDGQVAFLKMDMLHNYPEVYDYLLNLEDTDIGAYDGAYYVCVHFEVPADTYAQGDSRGVEAMEIFGMDDLREGYRSELKSEDSSQDIWRLNNY